MRAELAFPLDDSDVMRFMREALAEAEAAGDAGELPIGAAVVIGGELVSRGRSRQRQHRSQLAHAELYALLSGGEAVWTRHDEGVLFTTVEPCPMCLGAVVMADVPHVVFAAHDPRAAIPAALKIPYVARHVATYRGGVLQDEAHALIRRYDAR